MMWFLASGPCLLPQMWELGLSTGSDEVVNNLNTWRNDWGNNLKQKGSWSVKKVHNPKQTNGSPTPRRPTEEQRVTYPE